MGHLSLMDMLDRENDDDTSGKVRLMTLHAAKGLEFRSVYLVGMEEELLPHRNNSEGSGLEEERRLAYVGITRARDQLCLTYAMSRTRYGERMECVPSRFLEELPEELLDWEGRGEPATQDERRTLNRNAIANLRGLLN